MENKHMKYCEALNISTVFVLFGREGVGVHGLKN